MRSRLSGGRRFRRIMKGLPDAMRGQLVSVLNSGGRAILSAMRARAPRRTGALRAGLSYRVLPKSLRLRVGLLGRGRGKLFYARIQDLGRKGQTVSVRRRIAGVAQAGGGKAKPGARAAQYLMRVRPMEGKRFITGRFPELKSTIGNALRGIWTRALRSIAGGGGE